jgi:hypothetical protein
MTAYTFKVLESADESDFHYSTYYGNTPDEARECAKVDLKGLDWELGELVEEEEVR